MKTLYLIRHAKSDRSDPSLNDFERPLNKRGEHDAPFMGHILAKAGVHPDLILSSPALRAKTTAVLIAKQIQFATDKIEYAESLYLADADTMMRVLQTIPSSVQNVFLIAHNPGLTELSDALCESAIDTIPTCGIVALRLKKDDWISIGNHSAELVSFDYPKKHKTH